MGVKNQLSICITTSAAPPTTPPFHLQEKQLVIVDLCGRPASAAWKAETRHARCSNPDA
jgi:hypothetical protein